jgi:hypothetical protein
LASADESWLHAKIFQRGARDKGALLDWLGSLQVLPQYAGRLVRVERRSCRNDSSKGSASSISGDMIGVTSIM